MLAACSRSDLKESTGRKPPLGTQSSAPAALFECIQFAGCPVEDVETIYGRTPPDVSEVLYGTNTATRAFGFSKVSSEQSVHLQVITNEVGTVVSVSLCSIRYPSLEASRSPLGGKGSLLEHYERMGMFAGEIDLAGLKFLIGVSESFVRLNFGRGAQNFYAGKTEGDLAYLVHYQERPLGQSTFLVFRTLKGKVSGIEIVRHIP